MVDSMHTVCLGSTDKVCAGGGQQLQQLLPRGTAVLLLLLLLLQLHAEKTETASNLHVSLP